MPWRKAGFENVRETLTIRMEFTSFADYWAPYVGKDGPAAEYVNTLSVVGEIIPAPGRRSCSRTAAPRLTADCRSAAQY